MAELPVDLLHWGLAILPLVALLVLLVGVRWKAPEAGPVGMFIALAVALWAFQSPFRTLAIASAKGLWDAVFILYVVWGALLLYKVVDAAGGFDALRRGIERFSRNDLFLALGFGWVFASFLQGIAGFGSPIAVVAPLLVGLGMRPLYAVVFPLIGHAWCNMFGTLAVGWLATLRVVEIEQVTATAFETAILLWVVNLLGGMTLAWLFGRGKGVVHALPMVAVVSLVHGGGQLALTLWNPVLSAFIPSTLALVLLYPLSRWSRYQEPFEGSGESKAMAESKGGGSDDEEKPVMGIGMALMPYAVLVVLTVAALVPPAVEGALDQFQVGFPFPEAPTGFDVENEAAQPYSPFSPLTHPGTFLLLSSLVAWLVYRSRGYYEKWRSRGEREGIRRGLVDNAIPASVAVVAFLVMSKVMDHSGQTDVLALGIAAVAPATVFAFLSNFIGVLGAFMTSSNTASNILFAPLQQETATALETLREPTIIAAQSTGGAIGNAIAPANVVLGTGTAGIVGREGDVLRMTLPWAAAVAVLVGGLTVLLNMFPVLG